MNVRLIFWCGALVMASVVHAETLSLGTIQPRLSPDGTQVAVSYQGSIGVVPAEGGALRLLTRDEGWDVEPAWSPDGKRLAFYSTSNFIAGQLKVIDAQSGASLPVPALSGDGKLTWHPTENRILGILQDRFPNRLAWVDLTSGAVSPLPFPEDPADMKRKRIAWALSPDGREMLYAVHFDVANEQTGVHGPMATLWRCASDGSDARELCEWPARVYDLTWTANGNGCIAVTDRGTAHNDLWFIPLEEPMRNAVKLTFGQPDEDRPSASAERLVYTTNQGGATALVSRHLASGTELFVPIQSVDYGVPVGRLRLKLGQVARVSVQWDGGKYLCPPGSLYRVAGSLGHFYTGDVEWAVPAGKYRIRAFRGMESVPADVSVTVGEGQLTEAVIPLERWITLSDRGWYSGENHVHANYGYGEWYNTPESILAQVQGEDLRVCNAVVANSDGDAVFDREFFLGKLDPVSTPEHLIYWNQEFRATLWGHMTLSNLSQLVEPIFTGFAHTTNPNDVPTNADVAQSTLDQGGVVSYTHPTANPLDLYDQPYSAKGSPVDVALGRVRMLDVMGNTYVGSSQLWYKFLNCGFPVVASAGTDCFLNRVRSFPPGWGRCYVHLPDGLKYGDWVKGQVAGRSFISNGAAVFLEVNGSGPGSKLELAAPGKVRIRAEAVSHAPMEKVELIFNGEVLQSLPVDNGTGALFEGEVEIPHTGWLALRCAGKPAMGLFGSGTWAHTNPVHVTIAGKPWRSVEDARYLLAWIDRLQAQFEARNRVPSAEQRQGVLEQLETARRVYREIAGVE